MRPGFFVTATLACAVVVSGCSSSPVPVPIAAPLDDSSRDVLDPLVDFYDQELTWRNCGGAECAKVLVPLDYDDPSSGTVELSMTRVPAKGDSLGALLVNPGGPGGSAFDYAKAADYIVSPAIRDSFDIVGVDPRGVGKSEPVRCLNDQQIDELFAADGTPDSLEEGREIVEDSAFVAEACGSMAAELWQHMDTVSTARDMDIVRAVLGEPVLNYLGKSYGTAIGATYAELFPEHVGRMVLDGVLPTDLSQEEVSLGQALGFEEAAAHFANECAESNACPFDGDGAQVLQAMRDFLASLDESPLPTADGRELTESLAAYAVLSFLYFPDSDYPRLREALGTAVDSGDGTALLALVDERTSRSPDGRYLDNSTDSFFVVSCSDLPFDGDESQVMELAQDWESKAPTFGASLAWGLLVCAQWPHPGEQVGEITAAGAPPILVVSTRSDPATPHQWGVDLANSLSDGHLVTWEAHNHTAYKEGSGCVDEAVDAYLLAGELPPADLVCS